MLIDFMIRLSDTLSHILGALSESFFQTQDQAGFMPKSTQGSCQIPGFNI